MNGADPVLYDYWRSSASYRVRIALGLLRQPYETHSVALLQGAHRAPDYLALNPQGVVPTLRIDGKVLTQSLAIIEYLHATGEGSSLLPADAFGQYRVRQISYAIAMDIHPICNLSVAAHAMTLANGAQKEQQEWMQHFIGTGLAKVEMLLAGAQAGQYCYGDTPTMADCCLVPQLYNADRWGVAYDHHAHIAQIAACVRHHPAFVAARPEATPPASC